MDTLRRLHDIAVKHDTDIYIQECVRYLRIAEGIFSVHAKHINKYSKKGTDIVVPDDITITMSENNNNITRQKMFIPNQLMLFNVTMETIIHERNIKVLSTMWVLLVMHIEEITITHHFREIAKACLNTTMHNKSAIYIPNTLFIIACRKSFDTSCNNTCKQYTNRSKFVSMIFNVSLCNICYYYKTICAINRGTNEGIMSIMNIVKSKKK